MNREQQYKDYVNLANYCSRLQKRIEKMQERLDKAKVKMKEMENQ